MAPRGCLTSPRQKSYYPLYVFAQCAGGQAEEREGARKACEAGEEVEGRACSSPPLGGQGGAQAPAQGRKEENRSVFDVNKCLIAFAQTD